MPDELPYRELPPPPAAPSGVAVVARLLDGLGFRYRWATEGLRAEDADFRPGPGSMSTRELLRHVARLVEWTDQHLGGPPPEEGADGVEALRARTLRRVAAARARVLELGDAGLAAVQLTGTPEKGPQPFWSMVNGPLADALTHVGQLAAWRRLNGNPAPRADVFRGRPPA